MVYVGLWRYSITRVIEGRMVAYRLINSNDNKLAGMMHQFLRILHDKNLTYCLRHVEIKTSLHKKKERKGMPFIWNCNYDLTDTNWLDKTKSLRLNNISAQEWIPHVDNSHNFQCKVNVFLRGT